MAYSLYLADKKHCPDRNLQTQDDWTEAIPKVCCLLEVELQQLSYVKKKLLKITNYPSLGVYRTIPKPQRMPAVLTLTETTHVTQSKSRGFSSVPFSSHFQCSVWFGLCVFMSVCFYICLFLCHVCQIKEIYGMIVGSYRCETWRISIKTWQYYITNDTNLQN